MKLMITGGTGFIGRNLAEQYSAGHDLAAPTRAELDLLDSAAVRRYLERNHFDAVIHAATERCNRALGETHDVFDRNCRMFFHLARNAHAFGRMIFLSSGAVYDRAHWHPRMREDEFDTHVPADPYGFSKYVCARAIDGMSNVFELRLFGVFGPYEDWRVRFLSNACCRAVWDMPVVVRRNVFFDYLDVRDLGRLVECFLRKELRHQHYNVCTGRPADLKTLAAQVVAASGKPLEIVVRDEALGNEYSGDNGRMLEEFPHFQFRAMDNSIADLYRWYEAHRSIVDPALLGFDE